jgi:hypothetical protein
VFDLFDFTPVADDPFKDQAQMGPEGSPAAPADQSLVGKAGANIVKQLASLAGGDESWAHYAGNPAHPMVARIGSAVGEEARRFGTGLANDLQTFMGPMYGEGHVPMSNEGVSGADYAGAGINLAAGMGGPGGETGVGAGWNPKAKTYLDSLMKQKPSLKPETAAVVQQMISKGPEWAAEFNKANPPGTTGVGFSTLATAMHKMEEAKKSGPTVFNPSAPASVTVKKTVAPQAVWSPKATKFLKEQGYAPGSFSPESAASLAFIPNPTPNTKVWIKALDEHIADIAAKQPSMAAGWTSPYVKKPPATPTPGVSTAKTKPTKTVSSTTLSPEQALGFSQPATQADLNQLFGQNVPALRVPTMKPYDPNVSYPANLAHETAPGTSGVQQPFNPGELPMDNESVMKRMQEQGYAPIDKNWLFWRGVKQHGPFSWDSAEVGYRDPSTKTNEPGLFLAPAKMQGKEGKTIATMYGTNVNPHVVRADNPLVVDWKKVSGGTMYNSTSMQKVIKQLWAKGHDAVLLKGIGDIGGHQDQLVVRHANQVRHPHAAFDPSKKSSRNLLAARGTGGVTPLVVPDEQEGGQNE